MFLCENNEAISVFGISCVKSSPINLSTQKTEPNNQKAVLYHVIFAVLVVYQGIPIPINSEQRIRTRKKKNSFKLANYYPVSDTCCR